MASNDLVTRLILDDSRFKGTMEDAVRQVNKMIRETNALEKANDALATDADIAARAIDRLGKKAKKTGSSFGSMRSQMIGFSKSVAALHAIGGFAADLDQAATQGLNFAAMLKNTEVNINDVRRATHGVISEFEMLKAASSANEFGLGLTSEQFTKLSKAASEAAARMGGDVNKAITDLIVGMSRQSKQILDNLGIIVSSEQAYQKYAQSVGVATKYLTDAEKKLAFKNATIEAINKNIKESSELYRTGAAEAKRYSTIAKDGWDAIKRTGVEAVGRVFEGFSMLYKEISRGANQMQHDWERALGVVNFNLLKIGMNPVFQAMTAAQTLGDSDAMAWKSILEQANLQHRKELANIADKYKRKGRGRKGPNMDVDEDVSSLVRRRKKYWKRINEEILKNEKWLAGQKEKIDNYYFKKSQEEKMRKIRQAYARENELTGMAKQAQSVGIGGGGGGWDAIGGLFGSESFGKKDGVIQTATDKINELRRSIFGMVNDLGGVGYVAQKVFGMLGDAAAGALGAMSDALWDAFAANESLAESFKKAMHSFLKAFGKQMMLESLKQVALSLAALARYDIAAAGQHAGAAALFGAAAAAAGFGARATAPAKSKSGGRGTQRGRGGTASLQQGQMTPTTMTFNINSLVSTADEESFARAIGSGMRIASARGY
jgi:hypothetical protein